MTLYHLRFWLNILCLFALSGLLTSCIVVKDYGDYWRNAHEDPCLSAIILNKAKEDQPVGSAMKISVRPLLIEDTSFLMTKDMKEDSGGNMIRYVVQDGMYVSYRLNESMRHVFMTRHPNSPVLLTEETATIPVLDEASLKILREIASDPDYWLETGREVYNPGNRPDCLHK